MTIFVRHVGFLVVGKPIPRPVKSGIEGLQTKSLNDFLKNLKPEEKTHLINAINESEGLPWGDKVYGKGSLPAESLKKLVIPIIQNGSIPENLDFNKIISQIGTPTQDYFEDNLFYLIQDMGMQGLEETKY